MKKIFLKHLLKFRFEIFCQLARLFSKLLVKTLEHFYSSSLIDHYIFVFLQALYSESY